METRDLVVLGLALYMVIGVHELGHILAGKQLGLAVASLKIGIPTFLSFRVRGALVQIGPLPLFGGVLFRDYATLTWKERFLSFLGGPLASILVGLVLLQFPQIYGWENLLDLVSRVGVPLYIPFQRVAPEIPSSLQPFVAEAWSLGIIGGLRLFAVLSLMAGVLMLIPLPALDGGRATLALLEGILGPRFRDIADVLVLLSLIVIIADALWCFFLGCD